MGMRLIRAMLLASLASDAIASQAGELTAQRIQDALTAVDSIPEDFHVRPLTTVLKVGEGRALRTRTFRMYCEPGQTHDVCPIYEELRVRPWTK